MALHSRKLNQSCARSRAVNSLTANWQKSASWAELESKAVRDSLGFGVVLFKELGGTVKIYFGKLSDEYEGLGIEKSLEQAQYALTYNKNY